MKCDVCKTAPATRRGVMRSGLTLALTFGVFCDICMAYPDSHASSQAVNDRLTEPSRYWIERLPEALPSQETYGEDTVA